MYITTETVEKSSFCALQLFDFTICKFYTNGKFALSRQSRYQTCVLKVGLLSVRFELDWQSGKSLSNNSTASFLKSSDRCEYRIVILISLCPSSSCTALRPAPFITNRLAKLCLRSWSRKSSIQAFFSRYGRWDLLRLKRGFLKLHSQIIAFKYSTGVVVWTICRLIGEISESSRRLFIHIPYSFQEWARMKSFFLGRGFVKRSS